MYDPAREELESEANAAWDYLDEAYGPTARDAAEFARTEALELAADDMVAAGVPAAEAYARAAAAEDAYAEAVRAGRAFSFGTRPAQVLTDDEIPF